MRTSKSERPGYARGTSVPVEKTRAEIDALLARHGAAQRAIGADDARGEAHVFFVLGGRQIRLPVKLPTLAEIPAPRRMTRAGSGDPRARALEQAVRERWRAVLLLLRAKLEAVALGWTTVEREFLADVFLPDGRRVGEALAPLLQEAYATGKTPLLLPPGEPGGNAP